MSSVHKGIAIVTGASSGLGELFAQRFAATGYDLLLLARREDRLRAIADRLSASFGVGVECLVSDLSTDHGLDAAVRAAARVDYPAVLVNNAGYGMTGYFDENPSEQQVRMLRVHLEATVRLTHAVLGRMKSRRAGAIINVSSVAGFLSSPGSTNYCATKAYLITFSRCLAQELAQHGVKVQALCPGFTHTEFHAAEYMRDFDKRTIPGFMWLDAEYVVDASLKAIANDKVVCIPGLLYKSIVWFNRTMIGNRLIGAAIREKRAHTRAGRG